MKKLVCIILLVCIVTASLACLAGCNNDEGVIKLTEVTHSVFYAPLYIAINNGYFEEEGITIDLYNGGGADKCMSALLSGQADIGLFGPEASIYVFNEGKEDFPIIFGQLTQKDGSFLIGRQPETNFSWTNLANKEIIVGRKGGVPAMSFEYALKKNNLIDGQNVTINYDVQFDLIAAAFEGGTGDYCTMFEPAASNFQKANKGYIIASVGEEAGATPFTAFSANKSYIDNNKEKVTGFIRAIYKGMKYINEMPLDQVTKAVQPSFAETDFDILKSAIKAYIDCGAFSTTPVMTSESFEHLQDIIVEAGVMSKRADFSKLVDNSIAEAVVAEQK